MANSSAVNSINTQVSISSGVSERFTYFSSFFCQSSSTEPSSPGHEAHFRRWHPPAGLRGSGAERATCWGQCFVEHVEEADEHVLVVPIIESVKGGQNIARLLEVDGVEIFFFGPADYSSTAGYPGQGAGPGVAEMIAEAKDAIRAAGKNCGVVATSNENLDQRLEQGFRMLALGLDGGLLLRSLRGALEHVGRARQISPSFSPQGAGQVSESVSPLGSGNKTAIMPGLVFESQKN